MPQRFLGFSYHLFFKCDDVRRDLCAILFRASNSLGNRRSRFSLNWPTYQVRAKAAHEISVMTLIFSYISRYALLLSRFGSLLLVS